MQASLTITGRVDTTFNTETQLLPPWDESNEVTTGELAMGRGDRIVQPSRWLLAAGSG